MYSVHAASDKNKQTALFSENKFRQTALVTGGAGFLGSHLCRRLLDENYRVICLDDFSTGNRDNIAVLLDHPHFSVIVHDVVEKLDLGHTHLDEIYNLACPASPPHYQRDPIKTMKTNVLGAINVLELARRSQSMVFQASTSEVYGDPLVHPQPEGYFGNVNPNGPRACYDEGKRCAETLFVDYSRRFGLPIKIVRIFNTYGPNMQPDDGRVVSNFIVQALQNKDITIYGDGLQTRSFCYVDDLIDGFRRFVSASEKISGPLNLGNPGEFTIRDLADLVVTMTGSRSRIVYFPKPTDDPLQRKPNIQQAHHLIGWKPTIELRDGLNSTICYFDSLLSENRTDATLEAAE